MIDLKLGGTTEWGVVIEPHSQREHLEIHGNTVYEFMFYEEEQPDQDRSDRIQMMITDAKGVRKGLLMNVEDVLIIIHGLSACTQRAIDAGVSPKPAGKHD